MIGPCNCGIADGKVLHRIVKWSACGCAFEADPRHSERSVEQLALANGQGRSAPGAHNDDNDDEDDRVSLTGPDVTLFREIAARCN